MIIRAWLIVGTLIIGVAWYLTVIASPPSYQASAKTAIDDYRQAGLMPAAGALRQSTAVGHEVFELPVTDAEHLKEEQASQMANMPGMNMPGMKMDDPHGDEDAKMPAMAMEAARSDADHGEAADAMKEMAGMKMAPSDETPGMVMPAAVPDADHGEATDAGKEMAGMNMAPADKMPAIQVPAADADHAEKAGAKQDMADMKMAPSEKMPAMQMPAADADHAEKAGAKQDMAGMKMAPAGEKPAMQMATAKPDADHAEKPAKMPGMAMDQPHEAQSAQAHGMKMTGGAEPEGGHDAEEAAGGHRGGGGIELVSLGTAATVDRTIEIKMTEWGYSPGQVMVKPGEVVRFIVTNAGNVPHEFMIMTGPGMASVGYRNQRADWSLTEHEAIYENPLVMPGDTFETVLKIDQPGSWMFMCMFPYHMQMGMMGMMMTEGVAGMNMGGMKM